MYRFFLIITLCSPVYLICQDSKLAITSSFGLGNIEGHLGFVVDGEISVPVYDIFRLGLYYNSMNSQLETNPVEELIIRTIDENYFDFISNYLHRNIHRSQNSIGMQMGLDLISKNKLSVSLGGGINYNFYKMFDITVNSGEPFDAFVTYHKWHDNGLGYHLSNAIYFNINRNISIGLKSRIMYFKDFNGAFMIGTRISLLDN